MLSSRGSLRSGNGYGFLQHQGYLPRQSLSRYRFVTSVKDFINLVSSNCIQTTSKRVELDQIQVIACLYIVCSSIQSGVVHPLVIDANRAFHRCQMRDGILSKYGNTIAVDQIRDTMMDFRVNMVWASCKDNTMASCIFQIFQGFFPFFLYIAAWQQPFPKIRPTI